MKSVEQLYRERPVNRFGRVSTLLMLGLVAFAWTSGVFDFGALFTERAQGNFTRFLTELRPYPLQGNAWDWGVAGEWLDEQLSGKVGAAILATLAFSIAAIVLAALMGLAISLFASRNLSSPEPFLPRPRAPTPTLRRCWDAVVWLSRGWLIFARAIPEYVWAFVLLIVLGPSAWPGVLALALHNAGILGRLFAEVTENSDPRTSRALRALGASRFQIATTAIWPQSMNRFLLFFFYRWETCVREATVLGLLGFAGLGYYILEAKAALYWDRIALWTLIGSLLIVAGDLLSAWARRLVR